MSSKKFRHKRIGYLAAALSFNHDSQMMLLCTNLIRKDLVSGDVSEVGLALSGLSNIITVDLAQTLILDVGSLVGHSRPSVRKKALLVLFRMLDFLPEHIDCYAPRIAERLYDTNKCTQCVISMYAAPDISFIHAHQPSPLPPLTFYAN